MNIAYLIIAHHKIEQVYSLIDALDSENSFFFIHVKKSFKFDLDEKFRIRENIFFSPVRFDSGWSGFKTVLATFELIKSAIEFSKRIDYFILLSGQCFPVKSLNTINKQLKTFKDRCVIECTPLPDINQVTGGLQKIEHRWFMDETQYWNPYIKKYSHKILHFFEDLFHLKRKYPAGFKPYWGSTWWAMPREAIEYVLNFNELRPDFLTFHKKAFCPDELYFQSVIGNSRFKSQIINRPFRYLEWGHDGPRTLTISDYETLKQTDHLFARKFDPAQSAELIEALKRNVL